MVQTDAPEVGGRWRGVGFGIYTLFRIVNTISPTKIVSGDFGDSYTMIAMFIGFNCHKEQAGC